MRSRSVVRRLAAAGGIGLGLLLAPFAVVMAWALVSPFASVPIPASCTASAPQLPADRAVTVPGIGVGTLLAEDAGTAVVVVAGDGVTSGGGTAYVVDTERGAVVRGLPLDSTAVVAAVGDGMVDLFDDKIGYILNASTGESVPRLIESDNYRGRYTIGGMRYLQLDADITTVGLSGSILSVRHVRFAGVADGCYFPPPSG